MNATKQTIDLKRSATNKALLALEPELVKACIEEISQSWTINLKSQPKAGLGMIQLEDSAMGQPFYLGEFPCATAWVTLEAVAGQVYQGAANIFSDDQDLAFAVAVADAALSASLEGIQPLRDLIKSGTKKVERENRIRKAMLAKTKVDFAMLNEAGGADAS